MIENVVQGLLSVLALYVAIGLVVAVPFVLFGIGRVDRAAKGAPWTFRLLVFPGVIAMWPYMLRRWWGSRRSA